MPMLSSAKMTTCILMIMMIGLFTSAQTTQLNKKEAEAIEGSYICHDEDDANVTYVQFNSNEIRIMGINQGFHLEKIVPDEALKALLPNIKFSLKPEDGSTYLAVNIDGSLQFYRRERFGLFYSDIPQIDEKEEMISFLPVNLDQYSEDDIRENLETLIKNEDYKAIKDRRESRNEYIKKHLGHYLRLTPTIQPNPALSPNIRAKPSDPNYGDLCAYLSVVCFIISMAGVYFGLKLLTKKQDSVEDSLIHDDDEEKINDDDDEEESNDGEEKEASADYEEEEEGSDAEEEKAESTNEEAKDASDAYEEEEEEGSDAEEEKAESNDGEEKESTGDTSQGTFDTVGQLLVPSHMFLHNDPTQSQYL